MRISKAFLRIKTSHIYLTLFLVAILFFLVINVSSTSAQSFSATGSGALPTIDQQVIASPSITRLIPNSGRRGMPIGISGSNFGAGTIAYFGKEGLAEPVAAPLSIRVNRTLPLIGSISVGITRVPESAPQGQGFVFVEYLGQRSNHFPFTVR